jgi:hypothetical protein
LYGTIKRMSCAYSYVSPIVNFTRQSHQLSKMRPSSNLQIFVLLLSDYLQEHLEDVFDVLTIVVHVVYSSVEEGLLK